MNTPAKIFCLFCATMAVTALGVPPPAPGDASVGSTSNHPALSTAERLGIKFSPATKDGEGEVVASPLPPGAVVAPGTVQLPPFVVRETKVKLTEKDVLTDKAKLELAKKRYLSPLYRTTLGPLSQLGAYYINWLSIFGGWHPNEVEAAVLNRQDERLEMLGEMDSLIRLETIGRALEAKPSDSLTGLELIRAAKENKQLRGIRFGAEVLSR